MAVKKSIAIIGEGETEWWYFETLRVACRYKFKVAPDFPQHSDIPHMAKLAEEYVKRDTDYVVCLVDMDRLLRVPAEMVGAVGKVVIQSVWCRKCFIKISSMPAVGWLMKTTSF